MSILYCTCPHIIITLWIDVQVSRHNFNLQVSAYNMLIMLSLCRLVDDHQNMHDTLHAMHCMNNRTYVNIAAMHSYKMIYVYQRSYAWKLMRDLTHFILHHIEMPRCVCVGGGGQLNLISILNYSKNWHGKLLNTIFQVGNAPRMILKKVILQLLTFV